MATIDRRTDKTGNLTGYRFRVCLGRDGGKQVWRSAFVEADDPRLDGLTPKRLEKQLQAIAHTWEEREKKQYARDHSKTDKRKAKANLSVSDFITTRWLPHVDSGKLTPTTQNFYRNMASDLISYFTKTGLKISEVDRESVEQYERYLRKTARTQRGEPLSDTTVRRHLETLRNVLRYAERNGYLTEDPFRDYQIVNRAEEAETVDFLRPEEAAEFLEKLDTEPLFWRAYMRLLLACGLRRGEALAITWADIDDGELLLTVSKNVTVGDGGHGYNVGATKSRKVRRVPLTLTVYTLLMEMKAEDEAKFGKLPGGAFVFHSAADPMKPISPTTPTTWLQRFLRKNEMRRFGPHTLRHTVGSLSIMAGSSLKEVSVLLGHSDTKVTNKFYVGTDEDILKKTVKGVEELIQAPTATKRRKEA